MRDRAFVISARLLYRRASDGHEQNGNAGNGVVLFSGDLKF